MKDKALHVVIEGNYAKCLHCGFTELLPLPMPINAFTAYADHYIALHKDCKPKDA